MVTSYQSASGLIAVYRSSTSNDALWKFPELSNQVSATCFVTSTTRVSPSQRPSAYPIHEGRAASVPGRSIRTTRVDEVNS